MPPHSARAAGRTIFPPACSASARTTATSSGSNILREFDTGCALAPERSPEPQDHATSLEEADLPVRLLCAAPAHRLIKGSGPGQIADAKGYQTDALLHLASIAVDKELCYSCSGVRLDTQGAGPEEIVPALRQPLVERHSSVRGSRRAGF